MWINRIFLSLIKSLVGTLLSDILASLKLEKKLNCIQKKSDIYFNVLRSTLILIFPFKLF